jgi:hypothetical protein
MASRTKLLTDLTLTDLWKEVKDPATLWGDLTPQAQRALKLLLQNRMHDELTAYLHAPRYRRVRGRQGVRNGRYVRALTTTWGTIPDLEIPRARDGGFRSSVVPRYQRRMRNVDHLIQAVFLAGISTRRVGRTSAEILGDTVSVSTVSTITRTLDHAVVAWRSHDRGAWAGRLLGFIRMVFAYVCSPSFTRPGKAPRFCRSLRSLAVRCGRWGVNPQARWRRPT